MQTRGPSLTPSPGRVHSAGSPLLPFVKRGHFSTSMVEKYRLNEKWLQKPRYEGLEWLETVASGPNCAFPVSSTSPLSQPPE